MADIKEVGQDVKKSTDKALNTIKKKFKEKPVFYTALACVVVFAVYKLFSSGDTSTTEEVVTDAYVPVGYDGYPELSDSMLSDYDSLLSGGYSGSSGGELAGGTTSGGTVNSESSSYVEDSYIYDSTYDETYMQDLEEQNAALLQQIYAMEEQTLANELSFTDEGEVYNALGELVYSNTQEYKVLTGSGTAATTQLALENANNLAWRNTVLHQMQANSSAYGKATTTAEKNALYSANQQLGKSIGLTYDSGSGKWYENNGDEALVYSNTSNKTTSSNKSTTTGSSSYGGVAYDKNTDYAALINKAKSEGASASTIATLTAQRNAKIAGENLNADGTKKSSSSSSNGSSSSKTGANNPSYSSNRNNATNTGTVKTGGTVNSTSSVSYNKNTDYAAAIKKAKESGASQATINKLTAQRNAKIAGENLNSDGSKKK